MLVEQKVRLLKDLEFLELEKKQLTNGAHDLAEKYEQASYNHTQLMTR